jgi:hypothetical protein
MLHNRAESLEEYDVRGIGALAEDVESHDSEPDGVSEQSRYVRDHDALHR